MTSTVTPTSTATAESTIRKVQVQLAIYDLSNGIAKALSAQLLGPQHSIEIVPHTSILAFGKEYYFGSSGVEHTDPHHFRSTRQLFPIQIQDLGHTTVSQEEFEGWCQMHVENGLYASHSYDLFARNCNNFSHHAATEGLRLKQAVPEWILDVPRRVLASPMGSLLRPMLEQMQIAPSGNEDVSKARTSGQDSNSTSDTEKGEVISGNPWENLPGEVYNDVSKNNRKESTSSISTNGVVKKSELKTVMDAPLVDSYNRPLLSKDSQMIQQCTNKLKACSFVSSGTKGSSSNRICLNETQRERFLEYLNNVPQILQTKKNADATSDTPAMSYATQQNQNKNGFVVDLKELLMFLNKLVLNRYDVSEMERTFALMLTRLLVLEKEIILGSDAELVETLNVMKELIFNNQVGYGPSTRAMAWCVLGNIMGVNRALLVVDDGQFLDTFVDCAMLDISIQREKSVEVRRGASAFLYNLVLIVRESDDSVPVSDFNVKMLCEIMEALPYEEDAVVATRMLLTVGKIIKRDNHVNTAATSLLKELGYRNSLIALSQREKYCQGDEFCRLAREIIQFL